MPKTKRSNGHNHPPAAAVEEQPLPVAHDHLEPAHTASAILYQPARMAAAAAAPRVMARLAEPQEDRKVVSVLSQALPEATAYNGRNYVTLKDVNGAVFMQRSGDGSMIVFDGRSFVDCGNPPHLQGGNPASGFTIEAWVKTLDTKGDLFIVAHGKPGREFFLRISEGAYEFGCWESGAHHGCARDKGDASKRKVRSEDIGMWVHLAGVYDRKEGKYLLYRNGALLEEVKSTTGPLDADKNWTIGAIYGPDRDNRPYAERCFKGFIAEVRLWTVGRTAAEIGGSMFRTSLEPEAILGGYWRLNDVNGTVALDSAPRKCHGSIQRPGGAKEVMEAGIVRLHSAVKAAKLEVQTARSNRDQAKKTAAETAKTMGSVNPVPVLNAEATVALKEKALADVEARMRDEQLTYDAGMPSRIVDAWPINDLSALTRKLDDKAKLEAAFTKAQTEGYFDPLVFPRIRGLMSDVERQNAVKALKELKKETFLTFYDAGQHLVLQRNFAGELTHSFVPTPLEAKPRLLLIEEYRLSSFLGQYGVGRPLKTFSLLPGEKTKLTVRVSEKTSTTTTQSSSILDSYSQESATEFEKSLSEEQSTTSASGENTDYHAEVSGGASCAWGHVEASAGVSGGTNSSREEFGKSVANATSKHAAKASNNRNVEIKNAAEQRTEAEKMSEVVREIENINIGRTLNFVFRQMNQEYITLLHLVDVKLGYTDGIEPLREVPLYEMDALLKDVIEEPAGSIAMVKEFILNELKLISDYKGDPHNGSKNPPKPGFVIPADEKDPAVLRYRINKDYVTRYDDPDTGTKRWVPGIIVSAKSMIMRTNDVVVEAAIGESPALDEYAESLQNEEIRTKRLANERADLENDRMRLEAEKARLLMNLVNAKDANLLKLYTQAVTAAPLESAPKRVISIWEPANGVSMAEK